MPTETVYADLVLAVAALIAGVLYLRARRRHGKRKKSGPPVRPATPAPPAAGTRGAVSTWAPPASATHGAAVAPTVVAAPAPSWDQPAAKGNTAGQATPAPPPSSPPPPPPGMTPGSGAPAPTWGAPAPSAPAAVPTAPAAPTWGAAP